MTLKEKRQAAADRGLCKTCRKNEPSGENVTCDQCLAAASEYKRKSLQEAAGADWCMECLAFGFHRVECSKRERAA